MNLNNFTLSKTGETAAIQLLAPAHLPEVMALHEETRVRLPEGQKTFILPQTPAYFEKFLNQTAGAMIGIHADGKLVAQLVMMGPLTPEVMIAQRAVTRNDVAFHHLGALDSVVVIKSMSVHPDFRGNELSQHLLETCLRLPLVAEADHAFAQISAENMRSWELFLEHGFGIVGAAVDPGDNKPRFILQRPATGFAFDMAPSADDVDPVGDFAAILQLTQREGLIGRLDEAGPEDHGKRRLAFSASAEPSSLPKRAQGLSA